MKTSTGTDLIRTMALGLCIYVSLGGALAAQQGAEVATPAAQPARLGPSLRHGPPLGITDTVGALHIRGFTATEALQDISRMADVVIGLEATTHRGDQRVEFDFSGGTVADLMNAFVAQAPGYQWQADNGIIHVFRDGEHLPLADLVLDYPGASDKTRLDIWEGLHNSPEYTAWMKSSQCYPGERLHPMFFHFDRGPIDIPPGKMTVAQLLDQVAIKTGDGFWAVLQSDPSNPVCTVGVIDWSWSF